MQDDNIREFRALHRNNPHYTATAHANYHYWELIIDGIGVARAEHGENHRTAILDYARTHGHNVDNAHILIHYPGQQAP